VDAFPKLTQQQFPIGQRLFIRDERLTGMIINGLHARIRVKKQANAGA
jgi:hypothetical protein